MSINHKFFTKIIDYFHFNYFFFFKNNKNYSIKNQKQSYLKELYKDYLVIEASLNNALRKYLGNK